MKLKKEKDGSGEEYTWTDYMSLQFTQNVSIINTSILTPRSTENLFLMPIHFEYSSIFTSR